MQKYRSFRHRATGSLLSPVTPIAWKNSTAPFCFSPSVSNRILIPSFLYQPSATSRTIIRLNPAAKKTVPMLECRPCDISGISSSTTT